MPKNNKQKDILLFEAIPDSKPLENNILGAKPTVIHDILRL